MRVQVIEPAKRATGRERYWRVYIWPEDGTPFRFAFAYRRIQQVGVGVDHLLSEVWLEQDDEDLIHEADAPFITGPVMREWADRFRDLEAVARANLIGALPAEGGRVRAPRARRELTDGFLFTIAERYRGHRELGRSPVLTLAHEYGVSRRTASNWVQKARAAGHLAAAPRGRAGEVHDDEGGQR